MMAYGAMKEFQVYI